MNLWSRFVLLFALLTAPAAAQTIPAGAWGSINYWGVGGLSQVLAPGLAGQCLQTQGVGSAPIWTTCFTIPPQNANTILANVTTNFVAPQAVDINRVLDTVGYDIARPPAPESILYKSNVGPTFNWQTLPPGQAGAVLTSGGATNPPFWTTNLIQPAPGNLFVASGGLDSNTCLVGSPCLTLQHALTVAYTTYNLQGSDLTINIGAGSFAGGQINGEPPNNGNGGLINIVGAGSANTTITTTIVAAFGANIRIGSMKINAASGSDILVENQSTVTLFDSDVNLASAPVALVDCYDRSTFLGASFNLTISGGGQYGFLISSSSNVTLSVNGTLTVTGTPNFSIAFVDAINNSLFDPGFGSTLVGTATGASYAIGTNSVIDMENVTYKLPGTGYGTITTNSSFYQPNVLAQGDTVYGYNTGQAITTGVNATAFGYSTLAAFVTNAASTGATAVGSFALNNTTVTNDGFGYQAGQAITSSPNNVTIGGFSMAGGAALTGTGNNTVIGYTAGRYIDSTANTNTAVGASALSGSIGTAMTGNTNIAIGYQSGTGVSSGANNILIGANAALGTATDSQTLVIGNSATGLGSNTINIKGVIQATGTGTPSTSTTTVLGALKTSGTGGLGYSTGAGAGGAVTQLTSRTTGVTLNTPTGAVTLFAAAPVVGTPVSFTLTNSSIAATDVVVVAVKSATNTYQAVVTATAAGSCQITVTSVVGTSSDSPVINFATIKGSSN